MGVDDEPEGLRELRELRRLLQIAVRAGSMNQASATLSLFCSSSACQFSGATHEYRFQSALIKRIALMFFW